MTGVQTCALPILGPTLIEADVVRLLPHSSSDDHNKYRTKQSLQKDALRDPLTILSKEILDKKIATQSILSKMNEQIKNVIEEAAVKAEQASNPQSEDAIKHVWSQKNNNSVAAVIDKNSSELVMVDAINRALKEEMKKNTKVLVFGEDVALGKGGVFTATRGLTDEFGENRCFNSPLAEASIVGAYQWNGAGELSQFAGTSKQDCVRIGFR